EAASRSAPGAKPTGAASVKGAAVGGTVVGGASASGTSAAGASAAGASAAGTSAAGAGGRGASASGASAGAAPAATPPGKTPVDGKTPVIGKTPAAQGVAPVPRPAAPATPPLTGKAALMQRYSTVMARAARNKALLAQRERKDVTQGIFLPDDVRNARDGLDTQMKDVVDALSKRDDDLLDKKLQTLESGVVVIEKYLKP
ncbi:MAG: hypothetical protein ACHQQ3_11490, partial [Gemmatimonadales bacterium]